MRALVVEDDATWAGQVGRMLQEEGWHVVLAPTAERALELLELDRLPDLVLLDLILPGMDGWTLYRELRLHDGWRDVPVLVMTGARIPELPLSGIVGFLSKGAEDRTLAEVRDAVRGWREQEARKTPAPFTLVVPEDMQRMIDAFPQSVRIQAQASLHNAAQLVVSDLPLTSSWLQAISGGTRPTLVVRVDEHRLLVQLDTSVRTMTVIAVMSPEVGWRGIA